MSRFRHDARHLPKQTQVIINQRDRTSEVLRTSSNVTKKEQTNKISVGELSNVVVHLDDTVPEYMSGIIRISGVEGYSEDGTLNEFQELVKNDEFHSTDELIKWVAKQLDISADIVEIS